MDRQISKLQIQDYASETGQSPEARYQKLRRDIDQGLDSQATWEEFVEICLTLGHVGEVVRALPHVDDLRLRSHYESQLEIQGIVMAGKSEATREPTPRRVDPDRVNGTHAASPSRTRAPSPAPLGAQHVRAGGSGARRRFQSEMKQVARRVRVSRGVERESVWDECKDAIEYLLLDAMPLRILGLTLLFPAAVALGFLLPVFVGEQLTSLLQYTPVLIALGLFLAYAQKILLHSAGGEEDPPDLFDDAFTMLAAGTQGFVRIGALCVLFIGPSILAFSLGLPIGLQAVLIVAGLVYLPMAILGVTVLNSWEAIAPRTVGRGIAVDLPGYLKLSLIFGLAVSLPATGIFLTLNSTLAHSAAVVGPLLLAPGLGIARLLGRYFYAREQSMRRALGLYRSLGGQSAPVAGESSRRAGLRRHDEKRQARGGHDGQQASQQTQHRVVEANAPSQNRAPQRGPVVAGPRSPILQHQHQRVASRQVQARPAQEAQPATRPESTLRHGKLGNHSHRPLRKK